MKTLEQTLTKNKQTYMHKLMVPTYIHTYYRHAYTCDRRATYMHTWMSTVCYSTALRKRPFIGVGIHTCIQYVCTYTNAYIHTYTNK